jgi:hypothetical protein
MLRLCKRLVLCVAVAIPLFAVFAVCSIEEKDIRRPDPCTPREVCLANLKQIEGAKGVWALEDLREANRVPTWSDLITTNYIPAKPVCPLGGIYTIGGLDKNAQCTIPEHALPQ